MRKLVPWMMVMVLVLVGCGQENPMSESAEVTSKEVVATTKSAEKVTETPETEMTTSLEVSQAGEGDFSDFERLTSYMEDTTDYFDELTEDEEDMALLGDSMFISMMGMKFANIELDYAMHMMADTWEEKDQVMANGGGLSDSLLVKDGEIYRYETSNKWEAGYTDTIQMTFDPGLMTMDYYADRNNPNNPSDDHIQVMVDGQEHFYMTVSQFSDNIGETSLMVLYCDGQDLCYGRSQVAGEARVDLSADLLEVKPGDWATLADFGTFETLFVYQGGELTYSHQ